MAEDGVAGLFGAAAGASAGIADAEVKVQERRIMLKNWDTVAAQCLNPYGPSYAEEFSLKTLWKATNKGNKACAFHSEFAADETQGGDYRRGIGLSRLAETLLASIERLNTDNMKQLMKENYMNMAIAEADTLVPHLNVLNVGKGSQKQQGEQDGGFAGSRKRQRLAVVNVKQHTKDEVEAAAEAVHTWLSKPNSALRTMLHLLSSGGAFFAANTIEKVGRSWVRHGPATAATAKAAAWARASQAQPEEDEAAPDDTAGLFG